MISILPNYQTWNYSNLDYTIKLYCNRSISNNRSLIWGVYTPKHDASGYSRVYLKSDTAPKILNTNTGQDLIFIGSYGVRHLFQVNVEDFCLPPTLLVDSNKSAKLSWTATVTILSDEGSTEVHISFPAGVQKTRLITPAGTLSTSPDGTEVVPAKGLYMGLDDGRVAQIGESETYWEFPTN